ncbi:hypothetical protein ACRYCC_20955 [Actinomadura scrupuli]|uniref:hypothetical protein n=1 Tax=Actinomadura scrupuli TaxID=559629 RepID=UPI003D9582B0
MERCTRCELLVGAGCACAPGAGPGDPGRDGARWVRFAPDAILISPTRLAHLPGGCAHMTEADITAPGWGWISSPDRGLWERIGAGHPAQATGGNTRRVASKRCKDCTTAERR